jgi:hypothetical protein
MTHGKPECRCRVCALLRAYISSMASAYAHAPPGPLGLAKVEPRAEEQKRAERKGK